MPLPPPPSHPPPEAPPADLVEASMSLAPREPHYAVPPRALAQGGLDTVSVKSLASALGHPAAELRARVTTDSVEMVGSSQLDPAVL